LVIEAMMDLALVPSLVSTNWFENKRLLP
jgi:hypothetical protein